MQALTCFKSSSNPVNEILRRNESIVVLPHLQRINDSSVSKRLICSRRSLFSDIATALKFEDSYVKGIH